MQRIIIHWTGGPHQPTGLDLHHYHYVIDGAGKVHPGQFPVAANEGRLVRGAYAAHTLNCNTGSIGVALAAMAGAVEQPFRPGHAPVTEAQLRALAGLCRVLCARYAISLGPCTVLTHAEVQPTLGIAQRGKWDVTWLPGMVAPGPAIETGDRLRALIAAPLPAQETRARGGVIASIIALIARIFSRQNRSFA